MKGLQPAFRQSPAQSEVPRPAAQLSEGRRENTIIIPARSSFVVRVLRAAKGRDHPGVDLSINHLGSRHYRHAIILISDAVASTSPRTSIPRSSALSIAISANSLRPTKTTERQPFPAMTSKSSPHSCRASRKNENDRER
jgi:hypothetical protein